MAKVRYIGPKELVRHDDRYLHHGEVLVVHDDAFDGYMAMGAGKKKDGSDHHGHFECVEAPAPKPEPKKDEATPVLAAGDEKEA